MKKFIFRFNKKLEIVLNTYKTFIIYMKVLSALILLVIHYWCTKQMNGRKLDKNEKQAVVIVGAGNTHTPGIIQSLLQKKNEFPLRKLVLYDIDSKRMHLVYDIMKQFIYQEYPELEVIVTTDKEKAYTDIDFVFEQYFVFIPKMPSSRNYENGILFLMNISH